MWFPARLSDLVGADVGLHVGKNFLDAFPERTYPAGLIKKLNEAKRLGEKTGAGFYAFDAKRKARPDPALAPLVEASRKVRFLLTLNPKPPKRLTCGAWAQLFGLLSRWAWWAVRRIGGTVVLSSLWAAQDRFFACFLIRPGGHHLVQESSIGPWLSHPARAVCVMAVLWPPTGSDQRNEQQRRWPAKGCLCTLPHHLHGVSHRAQEAGLLKGGKPPAFSAQDIVEFIFFPVVNEGCRVVAEGIVDKPADLDVATVLAMGFPPYRSGCVLQFPFWCHRCSGRGHRARHGLPALQVWLCAASPLVSLLIALELPEHAGLSPPSWAAAHRRGGCSHTVVLCGLGKLMVGGS